MTSETQSFQKQFAEKAHTSKVTRGTKHIRFFKQQQQNQ